MDHTYIEEHHVADRYVQGTLPADEADRFENHYLSCPECLDRLDLAESLQRGFRRAATQDAEKLAAGHQLALLAWLSRLSRRGQTGVLLAALLVLALLPTGLTLHGSAELKRTRAALEKERQRSTADGTLRAELDASRHALAGQIAAREQADQKLAQMQQPQGNVPSLFLDQERGAGLSSEAPTQRLHRPATGPVFLALQVDRPFQRSYRVRLLDDHGREIYHLQDLQPDDHGVLSLVCDAGLLPLGKCVLVVEGLAPGAKPAEVGRFAFSVIPPQG